MWIVYVLSNDEGKLYIGSTKDLEKRILYHNMGWSQWTKGKGPWKLFHKEIYPTRTEALKREKYLKTGAGRNFLKTVASSGYGSVG